MNVRILGIDFQNDFCDQKGKLYVPGAEDDAKRFADMIKRLGKKITQLHMTLDSHHVIDIAHANWWIDSLGNHPNPFTFITLDDIDKGFWQTSNPGALKRSKKYVKKLKENNRYDLCIWPEHCIIGTWGHNMFPYLSEIIMDYERKNMKIADMITKGSNPWTEHYSGVQADVPDPKDTSTMLNTQLIEILQEADIVGIGGEALSHCLANTVRDIANNFGDENIKKLVLLEDCTSSVSGFENLGTDFVEEMKGRGMQIQKSTEFLA